MFRKISIRARITLLSALIVIVICASITVGVLQVSRGEWITFVRQDGDAMDLQETHIITEEDSLQESEDGINLIADSLNAVREEKEGDAELPVPAEYGLGENGTEDMDWLPAATDGDYMVSNGGAVMSVILLKSLGLMAVLVVIGLIGIWFAVKKGLQPVTKLSRDIAEIDEKSLDTLLPIPDSKDEIAELTKSFNHMLMRLNGSFEAQKRFSATAAHELKTPLSAIISNVEVLELDEIPDYEECLETISVVRDNAFRMEHLIQDLLRAYSNGYEHKQEICNLQEICERSGLVCMKQDDKQIEFEVEGELCVLGDQLLLERAVSNLIANAFRYNRKNGSVTVRLGKDSLTVKDTGVGIPEKDLDKILESFYCVDKSRSRELGGSGLGLSIAKQIFDDHQAELSIASEYGVGTEMTVYFKHTFDGGKKDGTSDITSG